MFLRAAALAVIGCSSLAIDALRAQEPEAFRCAPLAASRSRQPAYAPVAGQQRCEGFYEKNVAQPFLELVSLTRSPPGSWALDADGRLTLRGLAKADVRLTVQPMRSNSLYRVDALVPRASPIEWSARDMLASTGLQLSDLGFVAAAGASDDPPKFAPVSLRAADDGRLAYAVLRPSVAVSSIHWRAYRIDAGGASPPEWKALSTTPLFAWERIALPIDLPADGLGERIDVRALDSAGQALPLLQFVLVGVNDERP